MRLEMNYDLKIEQSQKLILTPELIQAIQILQFNTSELDSYITEELMVNPVLEQEEDNLSQLDLWDEQNKTALEIQSSHENEIDWSEYLRNTEYDDISYKTFLQPGGYEDMNVVQDYYDHSGITLEESLLTQLELMNGEFFQKAVAAYIIQSLDNNGYMTYTLEEIAEELSVSRKQAEEGLRMVQSMEPVGVGASDLRECLLIQLRAYGKSSSLAETIINDYLEELASNHISQIAKKTGASPAKIQEIADRIRSLEPKPGRIFSPSDHNRYIIPDVYVEKANDKYVITVNESTAPRLKINQDYRKMMLSAEKESPLASFLTNYFNSALWLVRSIEQRRDTIYKVANAVVDFQKDYFEKGPKYLKPLTLKQIAENVGIHESTVSRAVNGKYMQTPRGVFEIRYFFTSGVSREDGRGISAEGIKQFIQEMIEEEDSASPLSDQSMAEALQAKGIDISRRTVAKYRDEMEIPSSSRRKRFK